MVASEMTLEARRAERLTVYIGIEVDLDVIERFRAALVRRQSALRRAGRRAKYSQYEAVEEALALWASVQEGATAVQARRD